MIILFMTPAQTTTTIDKTVCIHVIAYELGSDNNILELYAFEAGAFEALVFENFESGIPLMQCFESDSRGREITDIWARHFMENFNGSIRIFLSYPDSDCMREFSPTCGYGEACVTTQLAGCSSLP